MVRDSNRGRLSLSAELRLANSLRMTKTLQSPETEYYFERFGFCERQILSDPSSDLGLIIVIPVYNEPELNRALRSIISADQPDCSVEAIIVINSREGEAREIQERNRRSAIEARSLGSSTPAWLRFHVLEWPNLPRKKGGVGLARKIGMDEGLRRYDSLNRDEGPIVCLDADCVCESNYLRAVEHYFSNTEATGAALYFEHPLTGSEADSIYEAITQYELHLRYYVQGLRMAGFPFAFHTVGSSMAVRASAYRTQGGMNKRQAGEDFYFLHKIIPLGGFGDLTSTRVLASPRASTRVPFGTGRAVNDFLQGRSTTTYNIRSFEQLRVFFDSVAALYEGRKVPPLPEAIEAFLVEEQFNAALQEFLGNSSNFINFKKRFFAWFDGFRTMKFLHFARDHFQPNQSVALAASELIQKMSPTFCPRPENVHELLLAFRARERENPIFTKPRSAANF